MKISFATPVLIASLCIAFVSNARADEEQDLLSVLKSDATVSQKCGACQQLRQIGTAKSVPVLASLLNEEKLSQAARYALEGMPCSEAVTALRQALGSTSGLLKAGVIDSLGWRKDASSMPILVPLLSDQDTQVASAAATALGRIGGSKAANVLAAALKRAPASLQPVLLDGLLQCADAMRNAGDSKGALKLYRAVFTSKGPVQVRVGGWHGMVLSDPRGRGKLILNALIGSDAPLQPAARQTLRELKDPSVIKACLKSWSRLLPDAQIAVLDAHVQFGAEAVPTVHLAIESPEVSVRLAGWQAVAAVNDSTAIPALARAAAEGDPAEREAARQALTRIAGPAATKAFSECLAKAKAPEKAELLRAFGERGDKETAPVLLQNAASDAAPVRLAALESLRKLAVPETAAPLMDLAARTKSDAESQPILEALRAVCQACPDKDAITREVVEKMGTLPSTERQRVLPVLAELATPAALERVSSATRDQDPDLAKEAVRVLGEWPTAAPGAGLLELARSSGDSTVQVLALRSCISVAAHESDSAKKLGLLQGALGLAKRVDEKKQALAQIGQIATPEALETALTYLAAPDLGNEAGLAAVTIAGNLANSNPKLAQAAAAKVLEHCNTPEIVKRAWMARGKTADATPFIGDWLVAGPYTRRGAKSALDLFDIPFAPEMAGKKVNWQAMPRSGNVNLAAVFPGKENCVAYLKARVIADQPRNAVLLLGSDDGVKAWLNEVVVHTNNVDRGDTPDQDVAPIKLLKGTNDLLLKITQGGGGWSAHARIAGADGQPLAGLQIQKQGGTPTAAAPSPVPATLPPRDNFQRLRLSDKFYAEGAYYGDFNHDGRVDIVAGPFWFEGPDFKNRHEYRPAKEYDPKGYSDNFLTYVGDFNGDGWPDVLCVPFPGKEGFWYQNPEGKPGHWKSHLAYSYVGNESPVWGDVNGDGRPELIFCNNGYLGYAGPNLAHPDEPWVFHAVSTKNKRFRQFTHGVGFGDINGDGRVDIVEAAGWWEQPAEAKPDQPWTFHPFQFAEAAAQMLVYDVDGDGRADIITAWHCHHYGLVWWQQLPHGSGESDWKQHVIFSASPDLATADFRPSQMHALDLVDINGDGLMDILTGKRFWAHGPTGDKEPDAPAVLFWLELRRAGPGNATFVPHLIDDNSGVGTQVTAVDLNEDHRPDVVAANKKGIFVHFNRPVVR